jgi:hypothetical protein
MKLAWQKLSKKYTEVIPTTGMLLISAHILNCFWNLRSYRKWDNRMVNHPEYKTSYNTQSQVAFLKYAENEYFTKHTGLLFTEPENIPNHNINSSRMAS